MCTARSLPNRRWGLSLGGFCPGGSPWQRLPGQNPPPPRQRPHKEHGTRDRPLEGTWDQRQETPWKEHGTSQPDRSDIIQRPPLWTEWLTDGCKNITFPQLRLRAVNILGDWNFEKCCSVLSIHFLSNFDLAPSKTRSRLHCFYMYCAPIYSCLVTKE